MRNQSLTWAGLRTARPPSSEDCVTTLEGAMAGWSCLAQRRRQLKMPAAATLQSEESGSFESFSLFRCEFRLHIHLPKYFCFCPSFIHLSLNITCFHNNFTSQYLSSSISKEKNEHHSKTWSLFWGNSRWVLSCRQDSYVLRASGTLSLSLFGE